MEVGRQSGAELGRELGKLQSGLAPDVTFRGYPFRGTTLSTVEFLALCALLHRL
jgi:hypothetical protein